MARVPGVHVYSRSTDHFKVRIKVNSKVQSNLYELLKEQTEYCKEYGVK